MLPAMSRTYLMVMTQRYNEFKTSSFEARSSATISVFDIFSVEGASKFPGTLHRKMEESQQPKSKSLRPEQN